LVGWRHPHHAAFLLERSHGRLTPLWGIDAEAPASLPHHSYSCAHRKICHCLFIRGQHSRP
ncbi:MAG TPA: hypothetical protein P5572_17870, partial [Phycisphaerae bacterium]|nr:hypothetical protein [Phycisphaerae bacterium]